MLSKLFIENYRSIKNAELPLGKINILTGANNSGKSSVLFAANTLKNIVQNPNRNLDKLLFIPPDLNFGGFENLVFNKNKKNSIRLGVEDNIGSVKTAFFTKFSLEESFFEIKGRINNKNIDSKIEVTFPYPNNKSIILDSSPTHSIDDIIDWTGLSIRTNYEEGSGFHGMRLGSDEFIMNEVFNSIRGIDYIPTDLKFSQPYYGVVPAPDQNTEEGIAFILDKEWGVMSQVSKFFYEVFGETISIRRDGENNPVFKLIITNHNNFSSDIVNNGSGLQKIAYLLAKTFIPQSDFMCIDEPEIHLHPSIIRKLMAVFVETAHTQNKQFLISTHSENVLSSLLNLVIEGEIKPEEISVFHCTKENGETRFEKQEINADGQIEGGFKNFIAEELAITKTMFKL